MFSYICHSLVKLICYFCSLFILSINVYADLFYAEEKNEKSTPYLKQLFEEDKKEVVDLSLLNDCIKKDVQRFNLNTTFEQLKLIGLIKIENEYRALFLDAENNIIDLKQNDFIENDFIQIEQIDLRSVRYIHWGKSKNCLNPIVVTLKL